MSAHPQRTRLFLDIDGVLLSATGPEVHAASFAGEFLQFAVRRFDVAWLTTHCQSEADLEAVHRYLLPHLCSDGRRAARKVRASSWTTMKVEAIPRHSDSWWVDDAPLAYERRWMEENGLGDRLIVVNTRREREGLRRVSRMLAAATRA